MTKQNRQHNHLMVVKNQPLRSNIADNKTMILEQLTLRLDDDLDFMLVHESAFTKQENLSSVLDCFKPNWFFDVRLAPRLDILAKNRWLALEKLNELRCAYIDVFGILGADYYGSDVCKIEASVNYIASTLNKQKNKRGPYLFIFDNHEMLAISKNIIPSTLKNEANLTVNIDSRMLL